MKIVDCMNDLQKVQFEMLKEFIHICDKLNLTYYLVCGSALGAIKYSGFIPWDDDIDVALPRKDYELFCSKGPQMLSGSLFIQNINSEKTTPFLYSKIRNSNTTYIEKTSSKIKMNHGVFIDVFPLDGYPNKTIEKYIFEVKKIIYHRILTLQYSSNTSLKTKVKSLFCTFINDKLLKTVLEKYGQMIRSVDIENSQFICNFCNSPSHLEYAPCEQYGDGTWAIFEGIRVRVPEKYDEYLAQKYGDWRAELPISQQVGHHYAEIIDLKRSYKTFM